MLEIVRLRKGTEVGRLSGKIALVSGGSRGMGASHARAIVANDGKVVVGDIE